MSDLSTKMTELPCPKGIEHLTTQQQTYERIRYSLMIGSIPPGTSLTIRGLAEHLSVSPTPVREALKKLCAEGALTEKDNRRVITPKMNIERFEELIELRVILECHAALRAIDFVNERLIDQLEEIDQGMDQAIIVNNHREIVDLNQQFHYLLYNQNPYQVSIPLIESVWLQLGPYTRVALTNLKDIYLVDRHKETIKALRDRNANALTTAIEADIRDGIGLMGRLYLDKNS